MPVSERTRGRSRSSKMFSYSTNSKIIRSQNIFASTSFSNLPHRKSVSLTGLSHLAQRAEKLERWKARAGSFKESTESSVWSLEEFESSDSVPKPSVKPPKPTKSSMLRSKTCPASFAEPNYNMLNKKQKLFDLRCKALSTSMSSHALPNGETLHGFLIGARYNSGFTLDTRSLERYGVHIPAKNREMLFLSTVRKKQPSAKVFGCKAEIKDSHVLLDESRETQPREIQSEQELPEKANSGISIEQQLDEVFGPDEEGSSSHTTLVSTCNVIEEELEDKSVFEGKENTVSPSSTSHVQETSANLQTNSPAFLDSQIKDCVSSLLVSTETKNEENEQDFISHEAQELTQEILKECQASSSSFFSQGSSVPVANISKWSQEHTVLGSETSNNVSTTDKSLQTSFRHLSIGEDSYKENTELEIPGTELWTEGRRPLSASATRGQPTVHVDIGERPKSAKACLTQDRTIFIDMTSLQSNGDVEDS